MKELLKHIIYEHAINVFFDRVKSNLFSNIKFVNELHGDEQITKGTTYQSLTFSEDGILYHFYQVVVTSMRSTIIEFEFDTAVVIDNSITDSVGEVWDATNSPVVMSIEYLVGYV